jgi:Family of unknown function (DUF6221)
MAEIDPVAFAEARLAEDKAAAKAAAASPWKSTAPSLWIESGQGIIVQTRHFEDAAHIARHDPARALREVEAGRRILARYKDCLARMEDPDYPQGVARDQAREYEDFVLPNLLCRWADHPDYDQDWKP